MVFWFTSRKEMHMLELRLRHWFKDVLGEDCEWVEPSRGGTVGAGDALVQLPRNGKLSVELKVWCVTRLGLRCDMRPAQIRYHYMTWHKGKGRTAIVFVIDRDIYVVDGKYVPKDKYNHFVKEKMVHIAPMHVGIEKATVMRAFVKAFNK